MYGFKHSKFLWIVKKKELIIPIDSKKTDTIIKYSKMPLWILFYNSAMNQLVRNIHAASMDCRDIVLFIC
ncbi:hypothetical protein HZS_5840 [Henneguya salminicola]|nr:hypothetical protein HZS_5840 [Henneguya salminicola]